MTRAVSDAAAFDLGCYDCLTGRHVADAFSRSILKRLLDALRRLVPARFRADIPVVPVVRLTGVIGVSTPLRPGLMLSTVARSLERAFAMRNARAVALSINSPGGSPAQSHLIFRRIRAIGRRRRNCRSSPSSRMSAPPAAT